MYYRNTAHTFHPKGPSTPACMELHHFCQVVCVLRTYSSHTYTPHFPHLRAWNCITSARFCASLPSTLLYWISRAAGLAVAYVDREGGSGLLWSHGSGMEVAMGEPWFRGEGAFRGKEPRGVLRFSHKCTRFL